jgi:hypothetical protein
MDGNSICQNTLACQEYNVQSITISMQICTFHGLGPQQTLRQLTHAVAYHSNDSMRAWGRPGTPLTFLNEHCSPDYYPFHLFYMHVSLE